MKGPMIDEPPHRRPKDWVEWHGEYDDPNSRLSARLRLVQSHLQHVIDQHVGPIRLISMCAGQGRDVIGVLATTPRRQDVTALLVELDPRNAEYARASIASAGLTRVQVLVADAALSDTYRDAVPADIVLACGVFGNITDDEIKHTISFLPTLCASGASVIWTRGIGRNRDIAERIRGWFAESGFDESAFDAPADATYRVGVHRLASEPRPFQPGVTLFSFLRLDA